MSAPGPYFCKFNHLIYPASVSLAEMCTGGISAYPCARRCALDGIWIVVAYTAGYDFAPPCARFTGYFSSAFKVLMNLSWFRRSLRRL